MWKCEHCGEDAGDSLVCRNCGYSREGAPPPDPGAFAAAKQEAGRLAKAQEKPGLRGPISAAQATWAKSVVSELSHRPGEPRVRYPVVSSLARGLRNMAWFSSLCTVVFAITVAIKMPREGDVASFLLLLYSLTAGLIVFSLLIAASEGLTILRDIEENTRQTAMSQCGKD